MTKTDPLQEQYRQLTSQIPVEPESVINPSLLQTFVYEYRGQNAIVTINTDEFTAICPWSGLPDFGSLKIEYVPDDLCIELKSLKYYLLSYSRVGIVQEHVANHILNDLVKICMPLWMTINLNYKIRGGLQTTVSVSHNKESGTSKNFFNC